jgi:anaerobic magnesium-protoporphyrin IX monomethyl ester cyclase
MQKKVTLIYPGKKEKIVMGSTIKLPLGLLSIGAYLEQKGYNVSILDMRINSIFEHDFSRDLCVGISNSFSGSQIESCLEVSKFLKSKYPNIKIIFGGVHPTLYPDQSIKNPYIDFVVIGEGEECFFQIIDAVSNHKPIGNIKGIAYKKNGKIIKTGPMPPVGFEKLPLSAYHLINLKEYPNIQNFFDYESSRGCTYNCRFCYKFVLWGKKWRFKTAEKVIKEISYLYNKYKVKEFCIVDDFFFVDKKRVEKICNGLINKKVKSTWLTSCRIDTFSKYDKCFVKLLKGSGCKRIIFGVESGSKKILKSINKKILPEQCFKVVELCNSAKITPVFSFMCGLPDERKEDILLSLDLIDKLYSINKNILIIGFFPYMPYKGTPLFDTAVEKGFQVPKTLEQWSKYQFQVDDLPWISTNHKYMLKIIHYLIRYKYIRSEVISRQKSPLSKLLFYFIDFPFNISYTLRWKYRFFSFSIEWQAFASIIRRLYRHDF